MNRLELAWAAGFFDGEGSTKKKYYSYKTKKGIVRKPTETICMAIAQCDKRPLIRFRKAVGEVRSINGPYQYHANKRPYWIWSVAGKHVDNIFLKFGKYLCSNKKQQYRYVKREVFSVSSRKKGWTYDK